jgi:hypothetical protein
LDANSAIEAGEKGMAGSSNTAAHVGLLTSERSSRATRCGSVFRFAKCGERVDERLLKGRRTFDDSTSDVSRESA